MKQEDNLKNTDYDTLKFDISKGKKSSVSSGDGMVEYRAYEKLPYVVHAPDRKYQVMNIYIPEAYFNGGTVKGYNRETAPVFMPNEVGGDGLCRMMKAGLPAKLPLP